MNNLDDLFTDTAAILNSVVSSEKLWAAEGAIGWKIYSMHSFQDKLLPGFMLSDEKHIWIPIEFAGSWSNSETPKRKIIVKSYRATAFFIIISHLPPGYPIISCEFKMAAVSVKKSISI